MFDKVNMAKKVWNVVKKNKYLPKLQKQFVGADAETAYRHLKNLSDAELRAIAKTIEEVNIATGQISPLKIISSIAKV